MQGRLGLEGFRSASNKRLSPKPILLSLHVNGFWSSYLRHCTAEFTRSHGLRSCVAWGGNRVLSSKSPSFQAAENGFHVPGFFVETVSEAFP